MGIFLENFDLVFFLLNFKIHLAVTQLSWWASLNGAPPRRHSLLRVASTWATISRRPPFCPVVFFEHIQDTFAAYGIPRRLSSFLYLPQQCGEESSSSSYRCQVRAFPWSSSTEDWYQHKKRLEKRATRGIQPHITNYGSFSRDVWFRMLDSSSTVRLLCVPVIDSFSFSCVHSSPASSRATLMMCEAGSPCTFYHPWHLDTEEFIFTMWFPHETRYLPKKFSSNHVLNLGTRFLLRG
jgi:hypothetical protein